MTTPKKPSKPASKPDSGKKAPPWWEDVIFKKGEKMKDGAPKKKK